MDEKTRKLFIQLHGTLYVCEQVLVDERRYDVARDAAKAIRLIDHYMKAGDAP